MRGQPVRHALQARAQPRTAGREARAVVADRELQAGPVPGQPDRAAEIAGAREALRAQTGVLVPPVYPAAWKRMLATVRDGLGEAGFDDARRRLADRPPPDIIAAAVGAGQPGH